MTLRESAREALLQLGDEQGFHWHPDANLTIHLYSPQSTDPPPVEIWRHALPLGLSPAAAHSLWKMIDRRCATPPLLSAPATLVLFMAFVRLRSEVGKEPRRLAALLELPPTAASSAECTRFPWVPFAPNAPTANPTFAA